MEEILFGGHVCSQHLGPCGSGLEPCMEDNCKETCGWRWDEAYRRRKMMQNGALYVGRDGLLRLHIVR